MKYAIFLFTMSGFNTFFAFSGDGRVGAFNLALAVWSFGCGIACAIDMKKQP